MLSENNIIQVHYISWWRTSWKS